MEQSVSVGTIWRQVKSDPRPNVWHRVKEIRPRAAAGIGESSFTGTTIIKVTFYSSKYKHVFILKGLHNKTSTIYGKYIFSKRKKKIYVLFVPLISISLYLKVYGFKVPKDIIIYLIYCYCFPNKTCKYTFIKKF